MKDVTTVLSFSTIPRLGAAITTVNSINSTGVVYAVQDGPFHISVKPVNAPIQE